MSYRDDAYDELPDAASIIVDHDVLRTMNAKVNSLAKKHAIVKSRLSFTGGVHDLLQCPVCANTMYPPILQRQNGHTLCSKCLIKVNYSCPSCQHELRNIRCLALEMVANLLEFSCRYQSLGCKVIIPYHEKVRHEKQCRFRPYNCPYAGSECSVNGDIPTLISHLRDHHKVDMHVGSTFNHRCSTASASTSVFISRPSYWGQHRSTLPSSDLWGKKTRPAAFDTVWRSGEADGSRRGRECPGASATPTRPFARVATAFSYPEGSRSPISAAIMDS